MDLMANALAPLMPAPHKMALPSSGLQTPEYLSPTAPVPPPVAPRAMPNALAAPNAYMGAPKKPQNEMLGAAVRGFQRGFDPEGFEQQRAQGKADGLEKQKQTLALMQQQRQLPEAQRTQWWQQNAGTIGQIIGQDISQQQVDWTQFSDQALDGQIAALSGQLGIAPEKPEYLNLGGVNVGKVANGNFSMAHEAAAEAPKPSDYEYRDMLGTDGKPGTYAINKNDPTDIKRVGDIIPKPEKEEGFTLGKDQIRYDADGNVIARGASGSGGPVDPNAPPDPDMIKLEREYAKDWDRIQGDFSEVNSQYRRAKALGNLAATDKPSRSAADLALVVTITKMLDPTSVAREGEVKLTASSASLVDQASNMLNQWQNGQTILPDATRTALLKMADTIFPSYNDAYEKRRKDAYTTAKEYGYKPERVMMGANVPELRGQDLSQAEVDDIMGQVEMAMMGTPASMSMLQPQQGGGPKVGQVEDGFRFKGGDASDQNNWEPVR